MNNLHYSKNVKRAMRGKKPKKHLTFKQKQFLGETLEVIFIVSCFALLIVLGFVL